MHAYSVFDINGNYTCACTVNVANENVWIDSEINIVTCHMYLGLVFPDTDNIHSRYILIDKALLWGWEYL
jgi:hypothetical protein